ncbi:MAG: InlB B-repeat-containing protein [Bacilli bacterium]|nr:InlB B-repeat-containing protein [Bacilli bacterium]
MKDNNKINIVIKKVSFSKYSLEHSSSAVVECIVTYVHKYNTKYESILIRRRNGRTNDSYLVEARQIFVDRIVEQYRLEQKNKRLTSSLIIVSLLLLISAIIFGTLGGLGYFGSGGEPTPVYKEEYLVNFDTDGGTFVPSVKVEKGNTISKPTIIPEKLGYTFEQWQYNGAEFKFDITPITCDITIKATYTKNPEPVKTHTVTFVVNGGLPLVAPQDNIADGGYAIEPTGDKAPKKAGYTLQGWYTDEGLTEKFEFSTQIYKDYILYANWGNIKEYTVTFYDDQYTPQPYLTLTQTVTYNEKVQRPESPTKDGYTLEGWYTEQELTNEYDFNTRLTALETTLNLYAKFTINTYRVTYVANGGIIDGDNYVDVKYNETIPNAPSVKDPSSEQPFDPQPTWYTTSNFTTGTEFTFGDADHGTKVTKTLTLYAKYNSSTDPDSFEDDSWDVFLSEIEGKSFDYIKTTSAYADDYSTNGNTFVGLIRELTIEDVEGESKTCHVTVIDENKTAVANEDKFTFMVTDLDASSKFDNDTNYYPESILDTYLKSVLVGFPTIVKQRVSTTTIDCWKTYPEPNHGELIHHTSSLYIPSASQIFDNDVSLYPTENSQFAYFANDESKQAQLKGAWLRTPNKVSQQYSLYVDEEGEIDDEEAITNPHLIKPVFVIK